MESTERARGIDSRPGRILLFVAVVWAVAGSYIAIQVLLEQGLDAALTHPSASTSFALSVATRKSLTCNDHAGGKSAAVTPEVRATAWLLGMKVGRDAIARQYASVDGRTLAAGRKDIETLAQMATVPVPEIFTPKHAVNANTDFVDFIESDTNATPRALTSTYASEACHLFKLGALWGYASMVRPALPGERNIFSAEIRHHAEGLVPTELWKAMVEPTSASASADAIFKADMVISQKVSTYLSAAH